MVNMWLTSYVANTLGYVAQQHHFIDYTFSKDDVSHHIIAFNFPNSLPNIEEAKIGLYIRYF